jgi:WD40 repeat protein
MRPGVEPLRELDRSIYAALDEATRASLPSGVGPIEAVAGTLPEARRLLLVVDQFEEIFTIAGDDARTAFVDALVDAAARDRATIVVAIRADFYGRCAEHPALAGMLGTSNVLVGPMSAVEYRRAIEGPARRAGLRIDPELVDALVAEVADEPGGLPLLSTAMVELWERREGRVIRMGAYAETGGVRGAVGRMAEAAYGGLTEGQRDVARSAFLRLASGEGEGIVRRRVPFADFDSGSDPDVDETLRSLIDARLLTVDEGAVEVAHEALLREWPRLVDWLEEDREGRRLREHLGEAARDWERGGRDPGELYRGARLSSALDWTTGHTLELNESERAFVAESRAEAERDVARQRRTNRRLRALLGVAAIGLVVAIGAGAFAVVQRGEAEQAAADAETQRQQAEIQSEKATLASKAADAQRLGAQALVVKDLDLSLLLAREGLAEDDSPTTRANLVAALTRSPAAISIQRPLPGRLLWAQATPDGKTLAVTNNEGSTVVIDTQTGTPRFVYPWSRTDSYVGLAGDNSTLVVVREEPRRLGVIDLESGAELREVEFPTPVGRISAAPDVSSITQTDQAGTVATIRDSTTMDPIGSFGPPAGMSILDVWQFADEHVMAVLHDGPLPDDEAVRAGFDQPATLAWYRPGADEPVVMIPIANAQERWVLSPDLHLAAIGNDPDPGSVAVYDLATGERRSLHGRHSQLVQGLSFTPDSRLLGSGGDDNQLILWNVDSGDIVETMAGHNGRVFAPAFSERDGQLTAYTPSLDGTLMGWDVSGARRLGRPFRAGTGNDLTFVDDVPFFEVLPALAVSPDAKLLAVAQQGGVAIRDAATNELVRELPAGGGGIVTDVAWSPDGDRLAAAGSGEAIVQLWDAGTWSTAGPLTGPPSRRPAWDSERELADDGERVNIARTVAFSPDGRQLAAGTDEGEIWTWESATGDPTGGPIEVGGPVFDIAFDPRGEMLAAAVNQPSAGYASVFGVADRKVRYTVDVDSGYARAAAVAFSPDGKTLATGGGTGDVRFWDTATGTEVGQRVRAASGWVLSIDWHPSEPLIVTGSSDGTTRMINVDRRVEESVLPGEENNANNAVFAPDGDRVEVVYGDGRGFDWTVDPDEWAAQACRVAGRALTREEWNIYLPGRDYAPVCTP